MSVIPADAVDFTQEEHIHLIAGMNDGEQRVCSDTGGKLMLSGRRPSQWYTWDNDNNAWAISDHARVQLAEAEKFRRIHEANDFINNQQLPGKTAMGRLKDSEKEHYNLWLDYLKALEAVDTSTAPDILWIDKPE
ncbi:TPA: tail fiber assembly protein [Enterobacter roggenkampii]|uniref:tail fiber assembly protein n=1 Tax=Enterobacter TaxID=547 RepID=UPI00069B28E9|nr:MULTISPECIES: tail fiber assembly protein [Enterobacter]MDU5401873.1 tail fiber assembly protein [Veillonella sp.]MCE1988289.1 tail fiber assembly protein [Enterobacter roggenkampii]MCK6705580.1 tail fiber assembly protein [Enterobacter roggenkampii]MCK6908480.1 tail fiber assembly protein [Enterobacter roggenkampii]MCK7200050.1 tail fiber assembly protein [Enterobacter roggenkampii]